MSEDGLIQFNRSFNGGEGLDILLIGIEAEENASKCARPRHPGNLKQEINFSHHRLWIDQLGITRIIRLHFRLSLIYWYRGWDM